MNSQVRTTFTILIISSALVLGLVVTTPAAPHPGQAATAQDGDAFVTSIEAGAIRASEDARLDTFTGEAPVLTGLATTLQDASAGPVDAKSPRLNPGQSNRIRQSMAMPFFSFAPRG